MNQGRLTERQAIVENVGKQRMPEPGQLGRTGLYYAMLLRLGQALGQHLGCEPVLRRDCSQKVEGSRASANCEDPHEVTCFHGQPVPRGEERIAFAAPGPASVNTTPGSPVMRA